jgi:uncharacterized membrane protein YdjX (TVP38/TMEM64 family)
MRKRNAWRILPLAILGILSVIIWVSGIYRELNFEALKQHEVFLNDFVARHYLYAVLSYGAVYILVVSLSIPGATFMTLTGGFLFGQSMGTLLTVISATIGASILYAVIRFSVSDDLLSNPKSSLEKIKRGLEENAFFYLMTLRLIPLFPFAMINLACAILRIPFGKFSLATLIGIIPGSWLYTSIGTGLHALFSANLEVSTRRLLTPQTILVLGGLALLSLSPIIYQKAIKYSKK